MFQSPSAECQPGIKWHSADSSLGQRGTGHPRALGRERALTQGVQA